MSKTRFSRPACDLEGTPYLHWVTHGDLVDLDLLRASDSGCSGFSWWNTRPEFALCLQLVICGTTPEPMVRSTSGHCSDANICPAVVSRNGRAMAVLRVETNAEARST